MVLPNNCRCSELAVNPANWQKKTANVTKPWFITYWFYDDTLKKKKQVSIRGMNHLKTWKERKDLTQALIDEEVDGLQKGFNPITKQKVDDEGQVDINEFTPVLPALRYATELLKNRLGSDSKSADETRKVINLLEKACSPILWISQVTGKEALKMLEGIGQYVEKQPAVQLKKGEIFIPSKHGFKTFTPSAFNHYRRYLTMAFGELVNIVIEDNPFERVKKRKVVKKLKRATLVEEEREAVKQHLQANYPSFYRYVQIFFHSGSRSTELLGVQKKDVNLVKQTYKITIRKGNEPTEVEKVIKNIALPYWQEIWKEAKHADEYLFSQELKPGPVPITEKMITKRWKMHVKDKLGITSDFYALKHLNLDEVSDALDLEAAKKLAAHTSTATTEIYTQTEKQRAMQKLKEVSNEF